jgi:hypothetical protein
MRTNRLVLFFAVTMFVCSLAYSRTAQAVSPFGSVSVCNDENVGSLSGFNNEAFCPEGTSASGGGYELVSSDFSQLLGASVNESMPAFSGGPACSTSGPTAGTVPCGWEVVGSNNTTIAGKIRVCVLCVPAQSP